MDILNVNLIKKLESNITKKLNNQDDMVDIRNFYGVFIPKDNKFIICKEVGVKEPRLCEFFIGELDSMKLFAVGVNQENIILFI